VRFQRISAKTYQRAGQPVSQVGDYLRATGLQFKLSGNPQETADAIEQTANAVYEAYLDWRLFARGHGDGGTDLVIEGMENFPQDENGKYVPFVTSKTQTNPETGEPMRLRANLTINGFVPARQ